MLDFHLGCGGIEDLGEHIGALDMDEVFWLQKNGFLLKGVTGHISDPPESLPYFDDVILTHGQVQQIYTRFMERLEKTVQTPGFKSAAIDKLKTILDFVMKNGSGLSTVAD